MVFQPSKHPTLSTGPNFSKKKYPTNIHNIRWVVKPELNVHPSCRMYCITVWLPLLGRTRTDKKTKNISSCLESESLNCGKSPEELSRPPLTSGWVYLERNPSNPHWLLPTVHHRWWTCNGGQPSLGIITRLCHITAQ